MTTRKSYPSDVSDEEWAFVVPYLALVVPYLPALVKRLRGERPDQTRLMLGGGDED
jgi:hypothetical protein